MRSLVLAAAQFVGLFGGVLLLNEVAYWAEALPGRVYFEGER